MRVGHGVRIPGGLTGRDALLAELLAWQEHLPGSAVWTGLTGAEVHGLWMPAAVPQAPRFVATGTVKGEVYPARPELAISRHPTEPGVELIDGVRVASAADCILAAARFVPLLDLVVLMDAAVQLRRCTLDDLVAAAGRRRRGARAMRAALPLGNGLSESPWETLLRLLHVVCGVAVEAQVELFDGYGAFVARADLRVSGTNLLQEYDGAQHRDAAEQRTDLVRARRLADIGAVRRGYVAQDVLSHSHLVLRAADESLTAALGRRVTSDPGPWLTMVAGSLYTPAGRRAFLEHLGANWGHLAPP